jgi:hypothetical protein
MHKPEIFRNYDQKMQLRLISHKEYVDIPQRIIMMPIQNMDQLNHLVTDVLLFETYTIIITVINEVIDCSMMILKIIFKTKDDNFDSFTSSASTGCCSYPSKYTTYVIDIVCRRLSRRESECTPYNTIFFLLLFVIYKNT